MSSISLCMIVKNEEKLLPACLESVKDIVDEMVIVDTGSTDRTAQIAKDFGAEVYHFEWIDDFSAARNYSLDKATGDWILWLDADETVSEINIEEVKSKLESNKLAYEVQIRNHSHENRAPFIHKSLRMFRNYKSIRFMNKIHEQPSIEGKAIPYYELSNMPLTINHVGYREDIVNEKGKKSRNFEILQRELKRKPDDLFLNFNIANEYLKNEDYHNALYHYKIATKNKKDSQMLSHAILRMVLALYELNRYEEMFSLLHEGKRQFPDYTDIYYFEADILEKLGRDEEAKLLYEKCLTLGTPKKNYVTRQGTADVLPLQRLSFLYLKTGYFKKAAESLMTLLSHNKYDIRALNSLLKIYKLNFSNEDIMLVLNELYNQDDNQEEVLFKLEVAYNFRLKNLFASLFPSVQEYITPEKLTLYTLFYHLSKNEVDIAAEFLRTKQVNDINALIMYFVHGSVKQIKPHSEMDKILNYWTSNRKTDVLGLDKGVFLVLLRELLLIGDEEKLTKGLGIAHIYENDFNNTIGNVFYNNYHYEMAATYYLKYLELKPTDFMATLTIAEIMLVIGKEIESVRYAHAAMNLNDEHFRSIEVLLEAYRQLGEHEQAESLAKEMLKLFPFDTYFKTF